MIAKAMEISLKINLSKKKKKMLPKRTACLHCLLNSNIEKNIYIKL